MNKAEKLSLDKGKALVLVAHPDDETIWMGGTILKHPNIAWTIFSLCRKNDADREPRFMRAVEFYNASPIISDLEDEGVMTLEESLPEIEKRILSEIGDRNFDYIFTHGSNGEYRHLRHRGVSKVVKRLFQRKELVGQLFLFAYEQNKDSGVCIPSQADFYLALSEKEFRIKRGVIKNIYGFSKMSFENQSCSKIETFKIIE